MLARYQPQGPFFAFGYSWQATSIKPKSIRRGNRSTFAKAKADRKEL